ncbi:MAG: hypothetical protein IKK03_05115 [Lachnospiraceae bacterium]|nr:hypothetical protein [Lachnospiraceae bacterium]
MCYNLSGELGREYEIALQNYLLQQIISVDEKELQPILWAEDRSGEQMVWSGM